MILGVNNTPLFFFGVALAILPAAIYGIPINIVDDIQPLSGNLEETLSGPLAQVSIVNPLPEKLEIIIPKESISSVPVEVRPQIGEVTTHLVDVVASTTSKLEVAFTEEPLNQISSEKKLPVVAVEPQVGAVELPEKLETIVSEQQLPLVFIVDDVQPSSGDLEEIVSGTLAQAGFVNPLTGKLEIIIPEESISSVAVEVIPQTGEVPTHSVDVVTSIPSKLEVASTEEPLNQISSEKKLPVVPVEPQVGLPEKLETIVSEQQLPLLSIVTTSQVDNTNLLAEKPEEVQETLKPIAVVASILHIENVQVVFPGKLLEKIFSKKPVHVDTDNVNVEETTTEALHPLAVTASIPQIGNIKVVFPGELVTTILSKKSIPLDHVESQPELDDITGATTTTLEEIVTEKPNLVVPVKSIQEVGNVLPEKLELTVPTTRQPLAVTASIPNVGNIQVVFLGELLDQILPIKPLSLVTVEPTHQTSDVTVLPESLEESITEKSVLLVPVELTPQVEEVVLETHEPLGVVTSVPQVDSVKVVETKNSVVPVQSNSHIGTFLPNGVLTIPALLESLGEIVTKKPDLLVPVESTSQLEALVPEILKPLTVVPSIPHVPGVVDEKSLPVDSISQGDDVGVVIPVALPSTVVNEISNVVLVVSPPTPETS